MKFELTKYAKKWLEECELDEPVYAFYALTPEEIKIVKGINT